MKSIDVIVLYFKLQVNNLHINITWSEPQIPRGPLSAFRLQIRELPNENSNKKSHVINVSTNIVDFIYSRNYDNLIERILSS